MRRILAVLMLAAVLAAGARDARSAEAKKFNVLFLNSYDNGYRWSDTILAGIKSAIDQSGLNVDLHIEYMDTKIRYNPQVKMHLYAIYAHKYQQVEFDVIIVADNNGFDFFSAISG